MSKKQTSVLRSIILIQWKKAVRDREEACTTDVRAYCQGCIDTCNEMLMALGYPRQDQSDEMMVCGAYKPMHYNRSIPSGNWEKIPLAVYN